MLTETQMQDLREIINKNRAKLNIGIKIDTETYPKLPKHPLRSKLFRWWLLKKSDFKCEYCKNPILNFKYHIDHLHPKSKGGLNVVSNFKIACPSCNNLKHNLPVEIFLKRLRFKKALHT